MDMPMNERSQENPHVLVVGPDGMALGSTAPVAGTTTSPARPP